MAIEFLSTLPTQTSVDDLEMHHLKGMVSTRQHVFSVYNKFGRAEIADNILDSCFINGDIGESQLVGVDVELRFFHAFRKIFNLVPALDCGDHTDFVGIWKDKLLRFDVTSNVKHKLKNWRLYTKYPNHLVVTLGKGANSWLFYVGDKKRKILRRLEPQNCRRV